MELIALGLFAVIGMFFARLCLLEVGRRRGERRLAASPEAARTGVGVVDGAISGQRIAFTFSGAATRLTHDVPAAARPRSREGRAREIRDPQEYPRLGLIWIDAVDQLLLSLRESTR
jgi:hypothetical protein